MCPSHLEETIFVSAFFQKSLNIFIVTKGAIFTGLKKKFSKKYIIDYILLELDNEPFLTTKTN